MIAMFWNYRGLGHASTVRASRDLCNSHRPNLIFLSETKICDNLRIQKLIQVLKFDDMIMILSNVASSGVALIWKSSLDIKIVASIENFITILVLNDHEQQPWQLTRVYGPVNPYLKPALWDDLKYISDSFTSPWCLAGDFDIILEQKDKLVGQPFTSESQCRFRNLVN